MIISAHCLWIWVINQHLCRFWLIHPQPQGWVVSAPYVRTPPRTSRLIWTWFSHSKGRSTRGPETQNVSLGAKLGTVSTHILSDKARHKVGPCSEGGRQLLFSEKSCKWHGKESGYWGRWRNGAANTINFLQQFSQQHPQWICIAEAFGHFCACIFLYLL